MGDPCGEFGEGHPASVKRLHHSVDIGPCNWYVAANRVAENTISINRLWLLPANQLGSAEVVLRRIMKMSWPARRFAETDVHKRAQAVLAVVLAYDHDRLNSPELAHDLCGDSPNPTRGRC